MADKKITELNELSSPQANDLIPIVNVTTGETQKVKYSNIASNVDLSSYATISYVDGLIENVDSFTETVLFDTDITLDASKIYIEKNSNSSARSLTIPSANSGNLGKFIFVYKSYNNGYNINCGGGGVSCTLKRDADSVLYISDGYSWKPHLNISNELLLSLTTKEPTITAGTTSQYWRGDKTWQTFPTISTPTLDEVTTAGNTTTNSIEVGGLVVDMPSGLGVAVEITKGGAGEALTVTKTSGSGNVASFTGGKTLISELDLTTPLADSEIASAATWNAKLGGSLTNNTIPKSNGAGGLVNSLIYELGGEVYITNNNNFTRFTSTTGATGIVIDAKTIPRLLFNIDNTNHSEIRQNNNFFGDNALQIQTSGSRIIVMGLFDTGAVGSYVGVTNSLVSLNSDTIRFSDKSAQAYGRFTNAGLALGSSTINASAQLDLQSTTKGFLPNRMTNAQRTAITSPAIGLMVYCTDATEGLYIYKSTGWTFII